MEQACWDYARMQRADQRIYLRERRALLRDDCGWIINDRKEKQVFAEIERRKAKVKKVKLGSGKLAVIYRGASCARLQPLQRASHLTLRLKVDGEINARGRPRRNKWAN